MSDFLMVVPADYTEIANSADFFQNFIDETTVLRHVEEGSLWEIAGALENFGALPLGMMVADARVFNGKLWIKFVPEA